MATATSLFYPESRFGGFTDIDGTIAFYLRINSLITPSTVLVDYGCGRGAYVEDQVATRQKLRVLKGKVAKVIGLDVDPEACRNPFLDAFVHLRPDGLWPIETSSIDLIVGDNVIEHLSDPNHFFSEAKRVLRQGGYLCIRTPNKFSYVGLISSMVPNKYHAIVLKAAQMNRKPEDVFPTLYRCNTISSLRGVMKKHGFEHAVYGYEAEPTYADYSRFLYGLCVLHQKLAPSFLRSIIHVFGRVL